jgi:hypothetical protein
MTAAESDLRGEVALAIMAYLAWAEFHGGAPLHLWRTPEDAQATLRETYGLTV